MADWRDIISAGASILGLGGRSRPIGAIPPGMMLPNNPMQPGGRAPIGAIPTFDPRTVAPPGGSAPTPTGGNNSGGGIFDPKTTAIDTTNPNAVPILAMLTSYLTSLGSRDPDPARRFTGAYAQLFGQPVIGSGGGSSQGRTPSGGSGASNPPASVNPNNRRQPKAPTSTDVINGRTRPTPSNFSLADFTPVNSGATAIRAFQPQYMNQFTANNFDAEAFLRSL